MNENPNSYNPNYASSNNYQTPYQTAPPNYHGENVNLNNQQNQNNNINNNEYDTFANYQNNNFDFQRNLININYNNNQNDEENNIENIDEKIQKSIRRDFAKKVYGILGIQLLITFILVCTTFSKSVKDFYIKYYWITYIFSAIALVLMIIFACYKESFRKFPLNYILLGIWTICEAIVTSAIAARYDVKTVVTAMGILTGVVIGLSIFASITSLDFTKLGMALFIGGIAFFFFGLFGFLFGEWMKTLYCVIGVCLFSVYLIYDTQLILGEFGRKISVDDYVFAAIALYLDIIRLFVYILNLVGRARGR